MTEAANPPPDKVLGIRIVAAIIDIVVLSGVFVLMSALSGQTETDSGSLQVNLNGLAFVLYLLIVLGYYVGLEFWLGATLGKKATGLRVVGDSGSPTFLQILGRNLLRFIDGLPFFYLVGFVTAAVRGDGKRIGDIAAHTRVVRR